MRRVLLRSAIRCWLFSVNPFPQAIKTFNSTLLRYVFTRTGPSCIPVADFLGRIQVNLSCAIDWKLATEVQHFLTEEGFVHPSWDTPVLLNDVWLSRRMNFRCLETILNLLGKGSIEK